MTISSYTRSGPVLVKVTNAGQGIDAAHLKLMQ